MKLPPRKEELVVSVCLCVSAGGGGGEAARTDGTLGSGGLIRRDEGHLDTVSAQLPVHVTCRQTAGRYRVRRSENTDMTHGPETMTR